MRTLQITALVFVATLAMCTASYAKEDNIQAKIELLQQQIDMLQQQSQGQIDTLKAQVNSLTEQLSEQAKENDTLSAQIAKAPVSAPLISFGKTYRMRKEEGLENESPINISGEVAMQYETQTKKGSASSEGFRAYEIPELFIDATVNDYVTAFAELPLAYEGGGIELEDGWIDVHKPLELAASGDTGLKIGQFHVPFGWDNQDNEGYVYGGRSIVDPPYSLNQRLDGISLYHSREIGMQGNYKLEVDRVLKLDTKDPFNLIFTAGVFNGTGQTGNGLEWDNDNERDWAGRTELHVLNAALGGSIWYAPATKNATTDVNNTQNTRDVTSYAVHFKYPDNVAFPGEDIAMGGHKYLIWGEWIWRQADEENVVGEGDTKTRAAYLEFDYSVMPTLVAVARQDYYDPDTNISKNNRYETTIGVKWEFIKNFELTLDYIMDNFKAATERDHIAAMLKAKF